MHQSNILQAWYSYYKRSGLRAPKNPSAKEEFTMKLSQAITNFMEYQKMNSEKKIRPRITGLSWIE